MHDRKLNGCRTPAHPAKMQPLLAGKTRPGDLCKKVHACSLRFFALKVTIQEALSFLKWQMDVGPWTYKKAGFKTRRCKTPGFITPLRKTPGTKTCNRKTPDCKTPRRKTPKCGTLLRKTPGFNTPGCKTPEFKTCGYKIPGLKNPLM